MWLFEKHRAADWFALMQTNFHDCLVRCVDLVMVPLFVNIAHITTTMQLMEFSSNAFQSMNTVFEYCENCETLETCNNCDNQDKFDSCANQTLQTVQTVHSREQKMCAKNSE